MGPGDCFVRSAGDGDGTKEDRGRCIRLAWLRELLRPVPVFEGIAPAKPAMAGGGIAGGRETS